MHEIRIHGRGGQGVVLASSILAGALAEDGKSVVAIPSFGFERRGAPVAAFLRCDDRPIRAMTNIYRPDIILCIDPTVARSVDILAGLRPGGSLVQTTARPLSALGLPATLARAGLCDAVAIAIAIYGRPITSAAMLGAFARTTGIVSLEALRRAMASESFRDARLEQNLRALDRGYAETAVHDLAGEAAA